MKNKVRKVQNTIRIAIDFINNYNPFKVHSKRSKMLTKLISNSKQLESNKTVTPSHLPETKLVLRRLDPQQQVTQQ